MLVAKGMMTPDRAQCPTPGVRRMVWSKQFFYYDIGE